MAKSFVAIEIAEKKLRKSIKWIQQLFVWGWYCEERIYCYSVILLSLVKIWKANVEIIYSLALTTFSRRQPVDLLSVNLFVKS